MLGRRSLKVSKKISYEDDCCYVVGITSMNETRNTESGVSFCCKVSENSTEKLLDLTEFISHICFIVVLLDSMLKYQKMG